jgi:iron complex outermembrane receptor protein
MIAAGSALAFASMSGTAFAQTQKAAAAATELEEVVVTAEKREVNLQKVSISIQVKDGADLRKTGKKRIDEIMAGTVGIQAQDSQVGVTFFVRGVDSSGGMGNVVAVPIIVDGVVQSRSESVRGGTLDMARAEIMRGPQSTTLGVNALAGAVSLVSNKPVFEYTANGSLTVGNYNLQQTEAVLNAPLSSNQALRLAYSTEKRKGYISSGAGDSDLTILRLKYRWQASDNFDSVFTVSHQNIGGNGVQQGVLLASGHWVPYTAAAFPGLTFLGCVPNGPVTTMGCPVAYAVVDDGVNFRQRSDAWNDGYPPRSFPINAYRDTNIDIYSSELNWTTGIGTVTFIPAVQKAHFLSQEPPRGTSYMAEDQKQDTSTLDLRLASKTGSKFEWSTGAYYSYDKVYNGSFKNIDFYGTAPMGPGNPCGFINLAPPPAPMSPPPAPIYVANGGPVNCYSYGLTPKQDRTSANVYFNGKYSFTDALRFIAALRYNDDKASVSVLNANIGGTDAGPDPAQVAAAPLVSYSGGWKKSTYRAGFEYDLRPGLMLYAVYNTGYNPGAVDGMQGTVSAASTLKQSTLGWKSQFLDNRLQLNGEIFITNFFNRTVEGTLSAYLPGANSSNCFTVFGPPTGPPSPITIVTIPGSACAVVGQNNATVPKYQSKGIDLDMTWLITADDRLTVTAENLKAAYDQAPVLPLTQTTSLTAADLTPAYIQSLSAALTPAQAASLSASLQSSFNALIGQTLQNSPKWSATLDYQHTFTLGNGSRLIPRLAGVYKQKYWSFGGAPGADVTQILADSDNPANLAWQQAYTTWDAYTTWENDSGKLTITGFMKNIGNKVILANYTAPYVSLQAPKTYGFTFNANFYVSTWVVSRAGEVQTSPALFISAI